MVHTPTTHSRMEKQTQEVLGEWDSGRGQKLGHVTEEAATQAESRMFQRRKAVTLGKLGDAEVLAKFFHEGAYPAGHSSVAWDSGLPDLSMHVLVPWRMAQAAQPLPLSPACCSLPASTHPGSFL